MTRKGIRCARNASKNGLCRFHTLQAEGLASNRSEASREALHENNVNGHSPTPGQMATNGIDTHLKKTAKELHALIINDRSSKALQRLGLEPTEGFDPKQALLWAVESTWRQARVWEAMLASVPEDDYSELGVTPIPGVRSTSRGARIELIQRHLNETTKNAARTSKLAIDAGIEERIVRLAEEQSALIADTVRAGIIAAIGSMHLSPVAEKAALELALGSAAIHLRQLAAGGQDVVEGVAVRVGTHG